jgi:hypothetical protein
MKKSILFLSLLLTIGSITITRAADDPGRDSGVLKNGSTVKVFYKGDETNDVKVRIYNERDQIIFAEKIKKTNGFSRPYNFSNLPSGNYKIELLDNSGSQFERVNYSITPEKRRKFSNLTRVGGSRDKFILSVPNKGSDKIFVTIYTEENAVLYSGEETITSDFAKVYSFEHYVGPIRFVVTDSNGLTRSWREESY